MRLRLSQNLEHCINSAFVKCQFLQKYRAVGLMLLMLLGSCFAPISTAADCKVNAPDIAEYYSGDCKNGLAHGFGTAKGKDEYKGEFFDGKPNGKGTYILANGNRYEGDFRDGKITGKGVATFANGDRYEGDWKDGKQTGKGVYTSANGVRYEGDFRDNKKHGKGVYTSANGNRYEGDFRDNKMSGKGVLIGTNDFRYEGDWKDDKTHGKGVQSWPNGDRYEGDWKDSKRTGKGIFIWANGQRYAGEYQDDKRYGFGTMTTPRSAYVASEHSDKGQWVGDNFVEQGQWESDGFIVSCSSPKACVKAQQAEAKRRDASERYDREHACDVFYPGQIFHVKVLIGLQEVRVMNVDKERGLVSIIYNEFGADKTQQGDCSYWKRKMY